MKQLLVLATVAAFACAAPAVAKPGNGHGNGHGHAYGYDAEHEGVGYGLGGCPRGLAKKAVPCMPPGQAKKLYGVGQRFRPGYGGLSPYRYNRIPYDLRRQYGFNPYDNYYYGSGYLYRVDPKTMLVEQIISALLYR